MAKLIDQEFHKSLSFRDLLFMIATLANDGQFKLLGFETSQLQSRYFLVPSPFLVPNKVQALCISSCLLHSLFLTKFLATDPEVPGSIPGATRFSEK
jgi:hypothetical protein